MPSHTNVILTILECVIAMILRQAMQFTCSPYNASNLADTLIKERFSI